MPPAFNLSQDQTLQFNACYCFLFFRIGRSLNVLTSSSHLSPKEKTLKTYLNTSVRLDTFASRQRLRRNTATLLSKTPSAHTYRLLVFKEYSPKPPRSDSFQTRRFLVAAVAAQKRDYVLRLAFRQQVFYSTPTFRFAATPVLLGFAASSLAPRLTHFLTPLRLIEKRRNGILVPVSSSRKGFAKRI